MITSSITIWPSNFSKDLNFSTRKLFRKIAIWSQEFLKIAIYPFHLFKCSKHVLGPINRSIFINLSLPMMYLGQLRSWVGGEGCDVFMVVVASQEFLKIAIYLIHLFKYSKQVLGPINRSIFINLSLPMMYHGQLCNTHKFSSRVDL